MTTSEPNTPDPGVSDPTPPSPKARGRERPTTFYGRSRRLIWGTFWTVFLLGFLITLFTAPTYQAIARVAPPPGVDVVAERVHILDPSVLAMARREDFNSGDDALRLFVEHTPGHDGTQGLVVECENPDTAANVANDWAKAYAFDVAFRGLGNVTITEALFPTAPIRPKRAQNVAFSGICGLFLGLIFAGIREGLRGAASLFRRSA